MSLPTSPIAVNDKMAAGATVRSVTAVGAASADSTGSQNRETVTMGAAVMTSINVDGIVLSEDPFDASKGNTYVFSGAERVPFNG